MGFKSVYGSLMDVFPQVDIRILKAVAIEHSKDADTAVEIVLSEVLPYLRTTSVIRDHQRVDKDDGEKLIGGGKGDCGNLIGGAEDEEENVMLMHHGGPAVKAIEYFAEPGYTVEEDGCKNVLTVVACGDSTHEKEALNRPAINNSCDVSIDDGQLNRNIENDELILLGKPQIQEVINHPELAPALEVFTNALIYGVDGNLNDLCGNVTEVPVSVSNSRIEGGLEHSVLVTSGSLLQEKCDLDSGLAAHKSEREDFDGVGHQEDSHVHDSMVVMENSVVMQTTDDEACLSSEHIHNMINTCSNLKSEQDNRIDLLEDMIEAAKKNKTTLFSAMESVMNLMREVEAKEDETKVVKVEAARGGLDILAQVEELKKMLAHAKEANNLHAGEVYGEKAILATEVKELQARLLSLSNKRDNALAILDEMHQAFKERLVVAEELRKAAELEKLGREESACNVLIEQEAIMDRVVQESKILQQDAEENSKLREFLMDRGRLVDTLQGEISIICQDVRLLKEKFDERVPLSKSISSSQTSCFLASSGSSIKSIPYDLTYDLGDKSTDSEEGSSAPESPEKKFEAEERIINCDAQPLDDSWEFCESSEI